MNDSTSVLKTGCDARVNFNILECLLNFINKMLYYRDEIEQALEKCTTQKNATQKMCKLHMCNKHSRNNKEKKAYVYLLLLKHSRNVPHKKMCKLRMCNMRNLHIFLCGTFTTVLQDNYMVEFEHKELFVLKCMIGKQRRKETSQTRIMIQPLYNFRKALLV